MADYQSKVEGEGIVGSYLSEKLTGNSRSGRPLVESDRAPERGCAGEILSIDDTQRIH